MKFTNILDETGVSLHRNTHKETAERGKTILVK
jgi:hypothetical protein